MGDSFSAGPGAGNQIDGPCKRNDKGYPAILQDDWPNGDAHTLKFISCSGAKIPDTMEKQLPQIDSSLKYPDCLNQLETPLTLSIQICNSFHLRQ